MSGPLLLPTWDELSGRPEIVATMHRYLEQIACVLRPSSVNNTDQALRAFAGFLLQAAPEVTSTTQITRRHIEDFKPWLAARPGQNKARVTTATLAHRLGTLRMFFVRIDEWGWEEAPARVPMFPGDLPRQDHPLPKALDDAAAAKLLRTAANDKRLLVRVTVEVLLRTGLRVGEFTALPADAVVQIGAAPWLHVPVGKLREDRYLPLHPQLVRLIDDYRTAHVPPDHPLLLPRENGRGLDRHSVTRILNRVARAAGLPHIHPHQLRHTLATQAINRGMSLEAIAATDSSATATAPDPPSSTAPSRPSAKPAASSRPASSSAPPCKPNTMTPQPKANTTAPTSSTSSSPASRKAKHHEPPPRSCA